MSDLNKACDYLNEDKNGHMMAHGEWSLDAGKLQAALEHGGIVPEAKPGGVKVKKSLKIALSILNSFKESSLYEDYQEEDGYKDEEYEAMLADLAALTK